jgi:hypothetical protein
MDLPSSRRPHDSFEAAFSGVFEQIVNVGKAISGERWLKSC